MSSILFSVCSLEKTCPTVEIRVSHHGRQDQLDNREDHDKNDSNGYGNDGDKNSYSDTSNRSVEYDRSRNEVHKHLVAGVSSTLFNRTMQELWTSHPAHFSQDYWKVAAQNRYRLAFDRLNSDNQHNVSTFKLSQLHLLHIASPVNKDVFTTGIAVVTNCSKKIVEQERYSILLREKDVYECPIGALAFYLLAQWSVCIRNIIHTFCCCFFL
jgi:hypothetical protein